MAETWKICSTCKKPIPVGGRWYRCSVSTCNSGKMQLAFCSMTCWDAHVPTMNHRSNVWAVEERAPARVEEPKVEEGQAARRMVRGATPQAEPEEVLIIASRLKDYIREQADFNTSADVMEVLSDWVREATRDAIAHARSEGRRTVMARDFQRR